MKRYYAPWEYPNNHFVVLDTRTGETYALIPQNHRVGENKEFVTPDIEKLYQQGEDDGRKSNI